MIDVCPLDDLPPGGTVRLPIDPPVAVFRTVDGQLFAIDDTCTHAAASLSAGWFEGCAVECPVHESRFDLRTGVPEGRPARRPVRTHDVTVVDGRVVLELSAEAAPAPRPRVAPRVASVG